MLPRRLNLPRKVFPRHTDRKFSWTCQILRIQAYKSPPDAGKAAKGVVLKNTPCFAVVVPKRLSINAVMRNTFKRRLMETIQWDISLFDRLPYQKYVLIPKEHLSGVTFLQINSDIKAFLEQQTATKDQK